MAVAGPLLPERAGSSHGAAAGAGASLLPAGRGNELLGMRLLADGMGETIRTMGTVRGEVTRSEGGRRGAGALLAEGTGGLPAAAIGVGSASASVMLTSLVTTRGSGESVVLTGGGQRELRMGSLEYLP